MMASAASSRKKSSGKLQKTETVESERTRSSWPFLLPTSVCGVIARVPVAILLLFLVYVWFSSSTFVSKEAFHICISSRKFNNLYCLSAGNRPSFSLPAEITDNTSVSSLDNASESFTFTADQSSRRDTNYSRDSGESMKREDQQFGGTKQEIELSHTESTGESFNNTTAEEEELAKALKNLKDLLAVQRSWAMPESRKKRDSGDRCRGKGIFVYDLPSKFNKDLMSECSTMLPRDDYCLYFTNGALGPPVERYGEGWYRTHQYSLEPIFHSRVLNHPCRVFQESQAVLFYVPFYGGLDVLRWHFKNVSLDVKDSLGLELLKWLGRQDAWSRNSGRDHVFVLGKVSWDFRRRDGMTWGSKFLEFKEMQNPMKLLIEREPWRVNEIGVPHPTYFHPSSDADIVSWQQKIMGARRRNLVGFAGAARPGQPDSIRSILIEQCNDPSTFGKCRHLDCKGGGCGKPASIIDLFLDSEFCLQPPGDSPTRKSVFDSLISGCIPVLFTPFTAYYQYAWHLPEDHSTYSVYINQEDLKDKKVNVVERLVGVAQSEREGMRRFIAYELLPKLVYGSPGSKFEKFEDAFMVSINNLLERVSRLV